MDILEMGAKLLGEQLGLDLDSQTISSALAGLLGDGSGNIDLAGLASKMASSGELGNILGSWLGDGSNSPISAQSIMDLFGENAVADLLASSERTHLRLPEAWPKYYRK